MKLIMYYESLFKKRLFTDPAAQNAREESSSKTVL